MTAIIFVAIIANIVHMSASAWITLQKARIATTIANKTASPRLPSQSALSTLSLTLDFIMILSGWGLLLYVWTQPNATLSRRDAALIAICLANFLIGVEGVRRRAENP